MGAPARRELTFASFDEVIADVERLCAEGYSQAGKWNLAQVCGHLSEWLKFPVDGFPKMGPVMKGIAWLLRNVMGKSVRKKILASGKMPERGQTMKATIPASDSNESAAVERLKEAIGRFEAHGGDYVPSPLFGRMTREECRRMHLIHCAHHLSFLVPKR